MWYGFIMFSQQCWSGMWCDATSFGCVVHVISKALSTKLHACRFTEDCNLSIQIIKNLKTYILVFLSRHSLLATRLVSEVNEELGLELSISDMMQHCTLQSMASFIENPTVKKAGVNLDLQAVVDVHSQDKAPWVALLYSRNCDRHEFTGQWSLSCFIRS